MLNVTNLCVDYGSTRVVNNINLALENDEILMLVGPTGCGKSTILQALAGLIPIVSGEIRVGNWRATPRTPVAPERRNVGMMFQDFALFPHLTVQQNVSFRLSKPQSADYWIELLGLSALRDAKPGRLSGGQKQRAALARTLAHQPAYVLLDEPLSNLDAALKDTLRWDIRHALKEAKVPAIWVTHDQNEALSVGDQVGVLNGGEIQQIGTSEECFSKPASRFIASFLGEASFLPGEVTTHGIITELGSAPVTANEMPDGTQVDLLLRPDDLSIDALTNHSNAHITWARFEGGTRLYAATLDSGQHVKIRTSHEQLLSHGQRVKIAISTTHPLTAFPV